MGSIGISTLDRRSYSYGGGIKLSKSNFQTMTLNELRRFSLGGRHQADRDKRDLFPAAIHAIEKLQVIIWCCLGSF